MKNLNRELPFVSHLPNGWGVYRLKEVAKINLSNVDKKSYDDEITVKLCNYVDVYYNDTITDKIDFMVATASEEQIKKLTLLKDDVILTKDSESPVDIGIPTWVSNDLPGVVCGYHLALIRPNRNMISGLYLYYLLNSFGFKENLWVSAKGVTRFGISKGDIQNLSLLLPPLEMQNSISKYLKQKDLLIDSLIQKKEISIKLSQQQRQSIITEAVTKGLNPNVKMKDSGVEWIGEIPEHWESKALKYCFKVGNGREIELELDKDDDLGINVYGSGGVFKKTDKVLFEGESVLFGRKGTIGKPLYVNDAFWTVDTMYYTKFYKESNPKWFYYLLLVYPWNMIVTQTALPSVVGSDVANTICAIPPFNEQLEIAEYLSLKDEKYFELIASINNQIYKLKEYRQSLIYEAVTGKIDVRDMELD